MLFVGLVGHVVGLVAKATGQGQWRGLVMISGAWLDAAIDVDKRMTFSLS